MEELSGYSLDDVKVHYNSQKPSQLQALAYTQGTEIHVAPGQEKHLPHETWHVVQQMQGRVKPRKERRGVMINEEEVLEKEADVMGEKASQMWSSEKEAKSTLLEGNKSLLREQESKEGRKKERQEKGEWRRKQGKEPRAKKRNKEEKGERRSKMALAEKKVKQQGVVQLIEEKDLVEGCEYKITLINGVEIIAVYRGSLGHRYRRYFFEYNQERYGFTSLANVSEIDEIRV